jgi:hypothetical protein
VDNLNIFDLDFKAKIRSQPTDSLTVPAADRRATAKVNAKSKDAALMAAQSL